MKTKTLLLIVVILLGLILFGCDEPNSYRGETAPAPVNTIPYGNGHAYYSIVTIDSCEYIWGFFGAYGGPFLTHKGNCKNPVHKINKVTVIDKVEYKLIRE